MHVLNLRGRNAVETRLISVIVPVYKVENYLERCIKSIVEQTYSNIEIILVDDGSPDRCPDICDEWKRKDERIKVIHKENGGLSDARNVGISAAEGEYLVFVDSDDWVSTDFIQILYKNVCVTSADICECEIIKTFAQETNGLEQEEDLMPACYETEQALKLLIQDTFFHQYVWNKIYKRECLIGIPFKSGKINEDEFWTYQIFGRAKRITKIQRKLYYYFQRKESIMGMRFSLKRLDALEAKSERQQYIDEKFPELSLVSRVNMIQSCLYSGQMSLLYLNQEEMKQAVANICSYFKVAANDIENLPISMTYKIWVNMAKINFVAVCKIRNWLKIGF